MINITNTSFSRVKVGGKEKAFCVNKLYLVLDIGTTDIKCGCIDASNDMVVQRHRKFPMTQNQQTVEIDFELFFHTVNNLITECLAEQVVKRSTIKALLIISQAQTFAPVDADFRPLRKGIVWLDERAVKEAATLKERLPDFSKRVGFIRPHPAQYASKLLWLKEHEPSIYDQARGFPLINEYLVFKLTGKFYSDISSFSMGGAFDFRNNSLDQELLSELELTKEFFPEIEKAAVRSELVLPQIQQNWNLAHPVSVHICGNDQVASACGAGVMKPGDANINFGTAMVCYTMTQSLITDLTENQIAGKHPSGDGYYLLSVSDFGYQIQQLKDRFYLEGTFDQLFQSYFDYPDVDEQIPPSSEVALKTVKQVDAPQFCAGIIKHYIRILDSHFSQISKMFNLRNIFGSGGMTQSKVWLDILRSTIEHPFVVKNSANAGLFGAITIYNKNH